MEDVTNEVNLLRDQLRFCRAVIEEVLKLPYPHRNPDGVDDGLLAAQLALQDCVEELDKGHNGNIHF
jgi:hypothetical protein